MGFQGASLADRLGAMARREDELMLAGIIRTCGKAREWQAAAEMDVPGEPSVKEYAGCEGSWKVALGVRLHGCRGFSFFW